MRPGARRNHHTGPQVGHKVTTTGTGVDPVQDRRPGPRPGTTLGVVMRVPVRPLPLAAAPLAAVVVASLTFSALALPATAAGQQSRLTGEDLASLSLLGDSPQGLADVDEVGRSLPTTAQRTAARALGAGVRWNDLGSPASVLPDDGSLGTAGGTPAQAARSWLRQHADVLGLTTAEVGD